MLAYYAERLNGVELNGSFYRTPPEATLQGWAGRTPAGFRFCLKAQRGLTYSAAGFDKEGMARVVGARMACLAERLGPVLLDGLLAALALPAAVEFRHDSWFAADVYAVLRAHRAALVVTDQDKWPRAPRVEVSPVAYYRLRRDYDGPALDRWRRELRAEAAARDALHVYFRHDAEGPARAARVLAS